MNFGNQTVNLLLKIQMQCLFIAKKLLLIPIASSGLEWEYCLLPLVFYWDNGAIIIRSKYGK